MSIQTIMQPNDYYLYCNTLSATTVSCTVFNGPTVITGDIIYHTLTQDNGNSLVDASGNAKLGNFTAGVADCVDVVASNSIFAGSGGIDTDGDLHVTGTSFLGSYTTVSDTTTSGTFFSMVNPSYNVLKINTSGSSIQLENHQYPFGDRSIFLMQAPQTFLQTSIQDNSLANITSIQTDAVSDQYVFNLYLNNNITPSGEFHFSSQAAGGLNQIKIEAKIGDNKMARFGVNDIAEGPYFYFTNDSGEIITDHSYQFAAVPSQPLLTTCDFRAMRNRNSVYTNVTGDASVILKNSDYVISASGNNLFDTTYVLTGSAAILTLPTYASLVTLYNNLGLSGSFIFGAPNRIPYAQDYFKFNVVNTLGTPVTISDSTDGKVVMGSTNQIDASSGVRTIYCFFQGQAGASGTATPSVICY